MKGCGGFTADLDERGAVLRVPERVHALAERAIAALGRLEGHEAERARGRELDRPHRAELLEVRAEERVRRHLRHASHKEAARVDPG